MLVFFPASNQGQNAFIISNKFQEKMDANVVSNQSLKKCRLFPDTKKVYQSFYFIVSAMGQEKYLVANSKSLRFMSTLNKFFTSPRISEGGPTHLNKMPGLLESSFYMPDTAEMEGNKHKNGNILLQLVRHATQSLHP